MSKTLSSEVFYVLKNQEGKFAKFTNAGGFDNENWKIYWVKNIDCCQKFDSYESLKRFAYFIKNKEKYEVAKIKTTTVLVNTCAFNLIAQ